MFAQHQTSKPSQDASVDGLSCGAVALSQAQLDLVTGGDKATTKTTTTTTTTKTEPYLQISLQQVYISS